MADPTSLTQAQKLHALAHRFYQHGKWTPKAGDYYTTARADLELYQVVDIKGGTVFTKYMVGDGLVSEWREDEFTVCGFGLQRVHVPGWVFDGPEDSFTGQVAELQAASRELGHQLAEAFFAYRAVRFLRRWLNSFHRSGGE